MLRPTWHDDVREAQLPCDGHAPGEQDHVLPPQLLDIPVEELQSHRKACNETTATFKAWNIIFQKHRNNMALIYLFFYYFLCYTKAIQ